MDATHIAPIKVRMTGQGWITEAQASQPGYRGPIQGREYSATPRTPKTVTVTLDGYEWPVWLDPADQYGAEIVA